MSTLPELLSSSGPRLAFKAFVIGFLMLLLLIPLALIHGTIGERQAYRAQAVASVAGSFAGPQTLSGPVLVLPYVDEVQVEEKDAQGRPILRTERQWRHLLEFPDTLSIDGKLVPAVRKRGLHEVRVYELQSQLQARFELRVPPAPAKGTRHYGQPYLSFAIDDVRGLVGDPVLTVAGRRQALAQGNGGHRKGGGLHAVLARVDHGQALAFDLQLRSVLGGTESLAIAPVGDSNEIRLASAWPHPQFAGRFLPRSRRIDANGFQARWDLSALAAGTQEQIRQGSDAVDALSVSLVDPVNVYSQADRASKYGLLFVLLTFVGFFMFELVKGLRIHPLQYALVGLALAIFFLLLLGLSEHLAFGLAYLLASVACIGLLGAYVSAVLRSPRRGLAFAGALGLLYAALYGLLVSEDNALLLGALMLFAILAALMLSTRHVDWYRAGSP